MALAKRYRLKKLVLNLKTTSNAFSPNPRAEVARILHELADKIADGTPGYPQVILDINGNRVGTLDIFDD